LFITTEDLIRHHRYIEIRTEEKMKMPIRISNKAQLTGIIILFAGVALLAFTFVNAFLFLQEPLGIMATSDLAMVFGEALGPLIQACIRLMYLGIMGWIGSLLTIRGIPLMIHKPIPVTAPTVSAQARQQPQPEKQPKPTPQPKPTAQPPSEPQPTPAPQPQQQPTPTAQPQSTPQQSKPEPQPSSPVPQEQTPQLTPEPKQEEPKAVLIPPENQREE
jgi:outer membrane biosynthesis protein TonB